MKEMSKQAVPGEIVCFNGDLVPLSQVRISPFDYGFLYGFGLFETMRSYSGSVFCLDKHLARLSDSARYLGIKIDPGMNIGKCIQETLQANNLSDARIRVTLSGGEGEPSPKIAAINPATLVITARRYTPYPMLTYEQGFKVMISSIHRNTWSPVSAMKSLNYLDSILALREAKLSGFDEGMFLNDKGMLAETSTGNIFLILGDNLLTPGKESGILPGITREIVLEIAQSLKIKAIEKDVTVEELLQANEAFITNSVIEIMPISRVNSQSIGSSKRGKITQQFAASYKMLVEKSQ